MVTFTNFGEFLGHIIFNHPESRLKRLSEVTSFSGFVFNRFSLIDLYMNRPLQMIEKYKNASANADLELRAHSKKQAQDETCYSLRG